MGVPALHTLEEDPFSPGQEWQDHIDTNGVAPGHGCSLGTIHTVTVPASNYNVGFAQSPSFSSHHV